MITRIVLGAVIGVVLTVAVVAMIHRYSRVPEPARTRTWLAAIATVIGAATLATLPDGLAFAAFPLLLLALPAAVIDATEHRLPNQLTIGLAVTGACSLAVLDLQDGRLDSWIRACLAGTAYAGLLLIQYMLAEAPGPGDVKYAAGLGLYLGWLGWQWWFAGILLSLLIFLAVAAVNLARRRWNTQQRAPLGPAMLASTVVVLVIGA